MEDNEFRAKLLKELGTINANLFWISIMVMMFVMMNCSHGCHP